MGETANIWSEDWESESDEEWAAGKSILGLTLGAIVVAYLVLRRTSQGRATTAVPGV